jgi:alcohol dehydrogenase (NADP+)
MPDTFKGYASHSHEKWSDFKLLEFKPKPWDEYDIDIKIECCGVCRIYLAD